jgi:hypothetical protein
MMRWFLRVWRLFIAWLVGRDEHPTLSAAFQIVQVTEDPDLLVPNRLYAVGENGHLWHAVLLCPCGCGERISLNLLTDDTPCWTLKNASGVPTLHPSVWRHVGCRSHFFLRGGRIEWCLERNRT